MLRCPLIIDYKAKLLKKKVKKTISHPANQPTELYLQLQLKHLYLRPCLSLKISGSESNLKSCNINTSGAACESVLTSHLPYLMLFMLSIHFSKPCVFHLRTAGLYPCAGHEWASSGLPEAAVRGKKRGRSRRVLFEYEIQSGGCIIPERTVFRHN